LRDEALVAELLGSGPRKELENILKLVCNIFGVADSLIALFGERKIWVLSKVNMAGIQVSYTGEGLREGEGGWPTPYTYVNTVAYTPYLHTSCCVHCILTQQYYVVHANCSLVRATHLEAPYVDCEHPYVL
jgi:hypothetical protein